MNHWTLEEDLSLEAGGTLKNPTIAYTTYGTLNADRDNVIYVCHALTASSNVHEWWQGLMGRENVLDPEKHFIVCANNLGSPYGTSSPLSINPDTGERYGMNFPFFTLRDTVALHLKLLEHLGINTIALVIGGSCGGNIALEMAISLGDRIKKLALLCCSAQETPWVIAIHESQRIALHSDPTFAENDPDSGKEGLRGARAFALPFYRSHPSFRIRQTEDDLDKITDFKAASYVRYQGQKFIDRYDAHCYYHQLNALDSHNVGRDRKSVAHALAQVTAKTVCIGFDTDLLIPVVEQQLLAEYIPNATYKEVKTHFGHDAFLIEIEALQEILGKRGA